MSRETKDSGVEWIGEIPKEWERTSLLNLLKDQISDGPHETPNLVDEGVPFISVDSLNDSENINFDVVKKFISEDDYLRYNKKTNLQPRDILFSKSATIGKTAIVKKEKFMVWSPLAIIRVNDTICFYKYIYYLLNCKILIKYVSLLGGYNTQINVGMRTLEKAVVPFPKLEEQKKIANFLDEKVGEIDRLIDNAKKSIEEYKKYKQSVITEAVTKGLDPNVDMKDSGIEWIGEIPKHWKVLKIKYILEWKSEKGYPNETVLSLYRDYGIVPKDSRDDNHNVTSLDTSSYKLVDKGDFVINKMKAWQGSMAVSRYRGIVSPAYHVCRFKNNNVNKEYFHYLLRNKLYLPEFRRLSTGLRIGQWDLGFEDFKKLPYLLPSNKEQDEIVNYLNHKCSEIDNLISKKEKLILELESYKKSLIYEYVTGKKEVL
ncbi:MAG: restriction endonuclease subunit S [Clostridiales bacterium]|nr:restriction endonuclease subunit S [Clostridiales bacterium]